jgi:hypothetical protein
MAIGAEQSAIRAVIAGAIADYVSETGHSVRAHVGEVAGSGHGCIQGRRLIS